MQATTSDLISELNALLRLTEVEAAVARARRLQARDGDIERELTDNAREADGRRDRIAFAIRDLGALPDLVGAAVARTAALARVQFVDQLLPLDEALFGDLALEHQLRDRAGFARALADVLGRRDVVRLCEDLDSAHTETIEWLRVRLAEVAVGGPPALVPSPPQVVARFAMGAALAPSRWAADGINRVADVVESARRRTGDSIGRAAERGEGVVGGIASGVGAARNTFLRVVEREADEQGRDQAAESLHRTRADMGVLTPQELPIQRYEEMNATTAAAEVDELADAADVRAVLAYEQANKARRGVIRAAQRRIEQIAAELAS
jgi:hypothetical protein